MIDSKKIISYIKKHINPYGKPFEGTLFEFGCKVIDYIKAMEKQPKADWIPCEVELPKTNGVYQVIREIKEGEVTYHIPTASYFDGQNTWHSDICVNFGRQNEQNVIAWQPIQPYKKEGADNE